jgi:hypothetical protein
MTERPRGAGRGGGVLFVALVCFLAYLAATALEGAARVIVTAALLGAAAVLLVNVSRRR